NEGKTTVTVHLALALSRLGRRVLVINCDLHGKPPSEWASSQAAGSGDNGLPGVTIPDGTDLHIITTLDCGTDPVSYLNSTRFRTIIKSARSSYDIVICDTPPILSVPDAVVVGRASDALLLVSASDNMNREPLSTEVSRRVASIGRPVCGVILTKADTQEASYTSYSGYGRRRNVSSIMGAIASTRDS
ncbi:MAG: tyrosine-protein kinase family protein, partial [Alphaproteobacteria bacterium]